jgi:hypothetical protein
MLGVKNVLKKTASGLARALPGFFSTLLIAHAGNYLASRLAVAVDKADALASVVREFSRPTFLIHLVLFFAGLAFARALVAGLLRPRSRAQKQTAQRRRVLVLYVSRSAPLPTGVELRYELDTDLAALAEQKRVRLPDNKSRWSWEQPLRAIRHHLSAPVVGRRLTTIVLMCSRESIEQLFDFHSLITKYLGERPVDVELFTAAGRLESASEYLSRGAPNKNDGHDFEDFDQQVIALEKLFERVHQKKLGDGDITVDITGGQKPASIAASAATLNRHIQAQYVSTNPREPLAPVWEYDVIGYDLVFEERAF